MPLETPLKLESEPEPQIHAASERSSGAALNPPRQSPIQAGIPSSRRGLEQREFERSVGGSIRMATQSALHVSLFNAPASRAPDEEEEKQGALDSSVQVLGDRPDIGVWEGWSTLPDPIATTAPSSHIAATSPAAAAKAPVPSSSSDSAQTPALPFGAMRKQFADSSADRKKNVAYLGILDELNRAHEIERLAKSPDDYERLLKTVKNVLQQLPLARSTHKSKKDARNTALSELRAELTTKLGFLTSRIAALERIVPPPGWIVGEGVKAGFEFEADSVYVFDLAQFEGKQAATVQLPDGFKKKLNGKSDWLTPHFKKRDAIFFPPGRTWEAQVDSTLPNVSNLEIVTNPLTKCQVPLDHKRALRISRASFAAIP